MRGLIDGGGVHDNNIFAKLESVRRNSRRFHLPLDLVHNLSRANNAFRDGRGKIR